MSGRIKLSKGLDIQIQGLPNQTLSTGEPCSTVALLGADLTDSHPRVVVEPGQAVSLGDPLILDKQIPLIQFTSPGSGKVTAINRGYRRRLQSIVIELDENIAAERKFTQPNRLDRTTIRNFLLQSGAWTSLRVRPFDRIPDPDTKPAAIFITATDTRPLAPNPTAIVSRYREEFAQGMWLLSKLDDVPIYLCTSADWNENEPAEDNIKRVAFEGPHPAGLPGTHIHFLHPASAARHVWHINYQHVIAIGHLVKTGTIMTERIVSLGGPGVVNPRLLLTRQGANLQDLLRRETKNNDSYQVISGSILDGFAADSPLNYLGHYHNQVSVIPDRAEKRLFGWFDFSLGSQKHQYPFAHNAENTDTAEKSNAKHGPMRAMMPTESFERVMPLNVLPAPLLRALLVQDTDSAQALGCLELAEEDLALCSYICPAKQDYGSALRRNLEAIEEEG